MTGAAYRTSAEMAQQLGPFARFERESRTDAARHSQSPPSRVRRCRTRVRRTHGQAGHARADALHARNVGARAQDVGRRARRSAKSPVIRNAQTVVIAPTGTIGLVMDCDTTGIEPDFALVKFKKLAGGGYFKIVNQSVDAALHKLGYSRAADRGDRNLRQRHRHARGSAAHQPRDAQGQRVRR